MTAPITEQPSLPLFSPHKPIPAANNSLYIPIPDLPPYLAHYICHGTTTIHTMLFPYCLIDLLFTEHPGWMGCQICKSKELMMCQWDERIVMVDRLFVYVDFQAGESKDESRLRIWDIFHSRLTFHRCKDFIHDMFFRVCENQYKNFSYRISSTLYNLIVFTLRSLFVVMANIEYLPFPVYLL